MKVPSSENTHGFQKSDDVLLTSLTTVRSANKFSITGHNWIFCMRHDGKIELLSPLVWSLGKEAIKIVDFC